MLDLILLFGIVVHLLANVGLLFRIWWAQDCSGISAKSQLLYTLVFTTRYLDVFTTDKSAVSIALKICFTGITCCTLLSVILFFGKTYEKNHDTARVGILIIPCMVIAMLINYKFTFLEICWAFSEYLEAVVMIPQFHMIIKTKRIHKHVIGYIAAIGIYRGLYIASWIYGYNIVGYYDKISVAAGVIQLVLNCGFFLKIWPWLVTCKNDKQSSVSEVEVLVDGEVPKAGHLASNVSTVVLTPDSLTGFHDDKIFKAKCTIEASEKCAER